MGDADFSALSETLGDTEALALADADAGTSDSGARGCSEVSPPGEEVPLGEAPPVPACPAAAGFASVT
ncbi:hypothetical protein PV392_16080 [Streptomyces sp. ME03-5709C]|nr:hypothetical protein [Streptomyces sp. ME03-5709C]